MKWLLQAMPEPSASMVLGINVLAIFNLENRKDISQISMLSGAVCSIPQDQHLKTDSSVAADIASLLCNLFIY